jgi:hypothetical protein
VTKVEEKDRMFFDNTPAPPKEKPKTKASYGLSLSPVINSEKTS